MPLTKDLRVLISLELVDTVTAISDLNCSNNDTLVSRLAKA